jgi:hypothetical protein
LNNKPQTTVNSNAIDNPIETAVNLAMKEQDERESKTKNILLFNIPESKNKDSKIRIDDEKKKVHDLSDILQINPVIKNLIRLGKFDENKTRPLLLNLENEVHKKEFLSHAKNLGSLNADDPMKKIVIKKDLTKLEREDEKALVIQLKERRKHGEDLVIRNGKIVIRNSQNSQRAPNNSNKK